MIEDKQLDIPALILRAFSVTKRSSTMAFVGIYSTETFEPLALTNREHVQINSGLNMPEEGQKKIAVEIEPSQIQAIIRHIRTPDNPLTQINIAHLRFVCLRNESGCMTGMSNFNMESKRDSVNLIDKSIFDIIHKHYTSQELLEGYHALQISAILKEEFIVIGMSKAGKESSLKALKAIFEDPKIDDDISENQTSEKESKSPESYVLENGERSMHFSFSSSFGNGNDTSHLLAEPEVELRESALSPEERRKLRQKRETSFCEDWRKATIKSIDALKLVGPFKSDDDCTDNRPLIDNIEGLDIDQEIEIASESDSETESDSNERSRVVRRPSRATMV